MPELPEVERLRRTLEPALLGRSIARAAVRTREMLVTPADPAGGFYRARSRRSTDSPRATASLTRVPERDLLAGATVASVLRHGKQLAIAAADGRAIGVHLGMTGQLLVIPAGRPLPAAHVHIVWTLGAGAGQPPARLVFRDPRRFGGVWTFPSLEALRRARWGALGPDALTLDPGVLSERLQDSRRPIKAALLDQSVVAGVGNIYADESLFLAGIRPDRRAADLTPRGAEALAGAIRTILARAVEAGGSTLRDYVDAAGQAGGFQHEHAVYGRGGQSCRRCGRPLRSATLAQRTTVWCPRCQK